MRSCCIVANRVTDEFAIDDEMQKRAGLVASRAVAKLSFPLTPVL